MLTQMHDENCNISVVLTGMRLVLLLHSSLSLHVLSNAKARQGKARQGKARQGKARQDKTSSRP